MIDKAQLKNVTIVVPVYGDWESLTVCIDSLNTHVDTKRHKVLLVNDCGPDVDAIEKNIKEQIVNLESFEYYRNDKNLGFVQTCNRAVFELDNTDNDVLLLNSDTKVTAGFLEEMVDVLYATDKHGCVCPRSNNATIASVPFRMQNNTSDRELDYAEMVYEKIKDHLPRYHVTPVAVGFCMLIKRELIKNFGLFDEVYGLGYSEENDFCQRINKYGFSSVMANHALVFHLESRSFTSEKKAMLVEKNESFMLTRYPYYRKLVERYINYYIDPVDWFADVIAGKNDPIKIMINLHHVPLAYNGTARNIISLLEYLKTEKSKLSNVEFTIVTNKQANEFHKLDSYGFRTVYTNEINELFHMGYCPAQIFHLDSLIMMNKYCLKIIFSHLDVIAIRSNSLLAHDFTNRAIFQDSFKLADKIISISDYTTEDTLSYYSSDSESIRDKFITIRQGVPVRDSFDGHGLESLDSDEAALIQKGGYVLILGNDYDHKLVPETLEVLKDTSKELIVVGPRHIEDKLHNRNVHLLESGGLSDEFMNVLKEKAEVIVFPSMYEGFGLPIAETAKLGKPLIIHNNSLNHEIGDAHKEYSQIKYFDLIEEIPNLIDSSHQSLSDSVKTAKPIRNLDDYNREVIALVIEQATDGNIDYVHLRERWNYYANVSQYISDSSPRHMATKSAVAFIAHTLKKTNPKLYVFARKQFRKLRA